MPDLLVDRHGTTAVLTLNRPDRLNAISGPMLRSLSEALWRRIATRGCGASC
jgi:enoyl-CoA hydratase/carnithine racemase